MFDSSVESGSQPTLAVRSQYEDELRRTAGRQREVSLLRQHQSLPLPGQSSTQPSYSLNVGYTVHSASIFYNTFNDDLIFFPETPPTPPNKFVRCTLQL